MSTSPPWLQLSRKIHGGAEPPRWLLVTALVTLVNAFIDGSLDALQEQTREHPPQSASCLVCMRLGLTCALRRRLVAGIFRADFCSALDDLFCPPPGCHQRSAERAKPQNKEC